jgi:putative membrane protein
MTENSDTIQLQDAVQLQDTLQHKEEIATEAVFENTPNSLRDYARLFFTGMAMGSADIVPGVSGGTMAFILGVYEDLLNGIKSVNAETIRLGVSFRIQEMMEKIPWQFLITLALGIGVAIVTLSRILSSLLDNQPEYLFSFFFGLVVASIIAIGATIKEWKPGVIGSMVAGAVAAFVIVGLVPADASHGPLVVLLSGMIAICAMILPGISGAFILLILGQYEFVIDSIKSFDIIALIPLAIGCVVGITLFARILSWGLKNYPNALVAMLVGFMIGSLRKIYPWKETLEESHGRVVREQLVLPDFVSGEFVFAVVLILMGFFLVTAVDHMQSKSNPVMRLLGANNNKKEEEAPAGSETQQA